MLSQSEIEQMRAIIPDLKVEKVNIPLYCGFNIRRVPGMPDNLLLVKDASQFRFKAFLPDFKEIKHVP